MFKDRKYRAPRIWSNKELKKFAYLFNGKAVNVSGWKDIDKEGKKYRDYFPNISEYWITNYKSEARGFQGDQENELYLDLTEELDSTLFEKFDVVFNHTVLEHIFNVNKAFENLCKLSKNIVIIVVPFLQEQHADYGDYWRFTPLVIDKLFFQNGLKLIYINYNDNKNDSIYIFAIGAKDESIWTLIQQHPSNKLSAIHSQKIGTQIISNSFVKNILNVFSNLYTFYKLK